MVGKSRATLAELRLSVYDAPMQSPIAPPLTPSETEAGRQEQLAREAQAIEEALRSSEEDGTIPFKEIMAWVASWDTQSELPPPEPKK
jgi:hypothetical protein